MFDIAFTELMVAAVVALIVIGPERLPRVARQCGEWLGKLQRYVNDVKADIQREVELDELKKLRESFEESARSIEQSVKQEADQAQQILRDLETTENRVVGTAQGGDASPGAEDRLAATATPATPAQPGTNPSGGRA